MKERRKKKKIQNDAKLQSSDDDRDFPPAEKPDEENNDEETTDSRAELSTTKTQAKKRPRNEDDKSEELTTQLIARTLYVLIPSDLSPKDAKKFRKNSRRQLKQSTFRQNTGSKGGNAKNDHYDEIEFVTQEDMPSLKPSKKKRRKQKEFPSIKELLKEKHQIEEMKREESKLQEKLNSIPESVRGQYVALDCEMVGISADGKKSALARVSLVDWKLEVLLDTFVQVPVRVTDFRTHVSGVEPKHIKSANNAMPVKQCRDKVAKLIKGKILVGHALTNDFKALMLSHPKETIRDTAKYRPFQRYGNGKWRPRKLRDLVKENLKNKDGFQEFEHDSVADAQATMELFQIVFSEWEKELEHATR